MCQRLTKEFYLYIAVAQVFRKGFISIKGIYLNAEIMGNEVTWLCPFNYPQKLSFEIDYEIMLSFLELYTNLLKFVNFKLFKDIGLSYPPPIENVDEPFFGFSSVDVRNLQDQINNKNNQFDSNIKNELNCDSEELKKILKKEEENKAYKSFFKNCVFYLNRETPKEILGLIISSCGGIYGDDSFNTAFDEVSILLLIFID
jgi:pescadillo protein